MWKEKTLGAFISRGVYTPIAMKVSPLGAFWEPGGRKEKNTRGLHFPRGLRHHRYESVALTGF